MQFVQFVQFAQSLNYLAFVIIGNDAMHATYAVME